MTHTPFRSMVSLGTEFRLLKPIDWSLFSLWDATVLRKSSRRFEDVTSNKKDTANYIEISF